MKDRQKIIASVFFLSVVMVLFSVSVSAGVLEWLGLKDEVVVGDDNLLLNELELGRFATFANKANAYKGVNDAKWNVGTELEKYPCKNYKYKNGQSLPDACVTNLTAYCKYRWPDSVSFNELPSTSKVTKPFYDPKTGKTLNSRGQHEYVCILGYTSYLPKEVKLYPYGEITMAYDPLTDLSDAFISNTSVPTIHISTTGAEGFILDYEYLRPSELVSDTKTKEIWLYVENATSTTKIPSMRIFYKDMTTNTVAYAGDLLLNQKTQKFFARMVYDKKTEGDDIKFYAGGNASSFINITLHLTHNTTISSPLYEGNITTMWGMSKGRFNSLGSTQSYPEDREVIITTYTFDKILKPIITDVSHNKENAIILSPGKWIIQDPYSGSMSDKVKITLFSTSPSPREEIIYPPNEYKLTVGESVALGGKKLTLDNVGADGGVMVTLKESTFIPPKPAVVIPENKLVVQVKDYKYDKSSAINRWAILKITAG